MHSLIILKLDSCIKFEFLFSSFMLKLGPCVIQKLQFCLQKKAQKEKSTKTRLRNHSRVCMLFNYTSLNYCSHKVMKLIRNPQLACCYTYTSVNGGHTQYTTIWAITRKVLPCQENQHQVLETSSLQRPLYHQEEPIASSRSQPLYWLSRV